MSNMQEYTRRRDALSKLCSEASDALQTVRLDNVRNTILRVKKQLDADVFRLMVVGEFSAGKSTFINALLGEDVLPASPIPTTAFINEVRYGETKRAVLHFLNPMPEFASVDVMPDIRKHVEMYAGREIPPIEIPVDQVKRYAVIPMGMKQEEANRCTPFEKLELFWPLEYLKSGIEIIDSPGLNEAPHRTVITSGYIRNADVVLFLTPANKALADSELRYVDNTLREMNFTKMNMFLLTTYFDKIEEDDQEILRRYVPGKAGERFKGCYFIATKNALICKKGHNRTAANVYDFWDAESAIIQFLTEECGQVRLRSMREQMLAAVTTECARQLGTKEKLLSGDANLLRQRVAEAEPKMKLLETRATNMEASLRSQMNVMLGAVDIDVRRYYEDLGDKVNGWANEFTPETKIRLLHIKEDAGTLTKEYTDYLVQRLSQDQEIFLDSTLVENVNHHFTDMVQSIGLNIELFFRDLQQIRNDVTASEDSTADSMPQYWKNALKNGVTLFTDKLGNATFGQEGAGQIVWKNILKVTATTLLLVLSPISWALTIAGAVIAFALKKSASTEQINTKCRNDVVDGIRKECIRLAPEAMEKIHRCLEDQLSYMIDLMMKDLKKEVEILRTQFQEAVQMRDKRADEVKQELALYDKCKQQMEQMALRIEQI